MLFPTGQLADGDYQTVEAIVGGRVDLECLLGTLGWKKKEELTALADAEQEKEEAKEEPEEGEVNWRRWSHYRRAGPSRSSDRIQLVGGTLVLEPVAKEDEGLYRCSVSSSSTSSSSASPSTLAALTTTPLWALFDDSSLDPPLDAVVNQTLSEWISNQEEEDPQHREEDNGHLVPESPQAFTQRKNKRPTRFRYGPFVYLHVQGQLIIPHTKLYLWRLRQN